MDRCGSTHVITIALSFLLVATTTGCQTEKTVPDIQSTATKTACKSEEYVELIGQDESVLDTVQLPDKRRILSPDMAMTMDYFETRLNFYLTETGKIIKIKCG